MTQLRGRAGTQGDIGFNQCPSAQVHCTREKSPAFGVWKQELLMGIDDVLRRCRAAYPLPASVMYNSTENELHRIEDVWAAGADPQQLSNGRIEQRTSAKR